MAPFWVAFAIVSGVCILSTTRALSQPYGRCNGAWGIQAGVAWSAFAILLLCLIRG